MLRCARLANYAGAAALEQAATAIGTHRLILTTLNGGLNTSYQKKRRKTAIFWTSTRTFMRI
jgi:hypothetical protein